MNWEERLIQQYESSRVDQMMVSASPSLPVFEVLVEFLCQEPLTKHNLTITLTLINAFFDTPGLEAIGHVW